ncbi:MAG: DUF4431 domain-containing protein [Deltaproteobacteria bacterium]|nr:DUF4431 domain-containing protein [Deltaproteobacteria bacterium]
MKKTWVQRTLTIIAFFLFTAFVCEARAEECLFYEPTKVRLTGVITRQTFPGPPNYESIEKGDEPETYWILKLEKPVCINGNPKDELNDETVKDIKNIHLVFHGDEYTRYRGLVSKKVVASGTLFHAQTAHHRTKVLMNVDGLRQVE